MTPRPSRAGRLSSLWPYAFVGAAFAASRLIYRFVYDVRFDFSPVTYFIQYMDPWFFKHDFARSLLYLHHQAPLQNVLAGVPLKLLDQGDACSLMNVVYIAIGLAIVLGALHAMLRLGAAKAPAVVLCALYAASPITVVYENWFIYHLPVACCLVLSLVLLVRYYRSGSARAGLCFFGAIATAALFRSTLGPLFLSAVVALVLVAPPPCPAGSGAARRRVVRAAIAPMLVLVVVSLKPLFLIGYGYGEAILWGNLASKILKELPEAERDRLRAEHLLSSAAFVGCLSDLERFGDSRVPHAPTGVPLLDLDRVPGGRSNAHALEYVLIAHDSNRPDVVFLFRNYWKAYLRAVAGALVRHTAAATTDEILPRTRNVHKLRGVIDAVNRWCGESKAESRWLLLLAVALPALVGYALYRAIGPAARLASRIGGTVAVAYMLLTIFYVTGVAVAVSCDDFSRYRYEVDPFYLVLAALLVTDLWRAVFRRVSPRPTAR
jgi:hypothetical protein